MADDAGSVAVALVVGLGVGGILGLLFAPKSGGETVKDLRRQAGEAKDDIKAAVEMVGQLGSVPKPSGT
jgi:gas vesicle protein